ncbi:MAG: M48 family metallopeptidase [Lentisphaerae bacterium]|nr:M48 family metallopeptidase [Lentisphaerota bacterium]
MTEASIHNNQRSVVYGRKTISFSLLYSDRKTMEIAVLPDTAVVVKAPLSSDLACIEEKIIKRARWILRQQNYFRQFDPRTPQRCYVNGETHLYLGKQYRLKINTGVENSVKLSRGFFHITCRTEATPAAAKKLLTAWYLEKARIQFAESLGRCWQKLGSRDACQPKLSIRRMQRRWGSLSDLGTVTLNTDLIRAPKECIDYVVTHELCHLQHRDHGPEFYKLLESVIPGWEKIKQKLELTMR